MGLFDDAGINPDDLVTGLPDGKHPARLSKVSIKQQKYGNKQNPEDTRPTLVFEYEIENAPFPVSKGFPIATSPISEMDDTDDSFNVYVARTRTIRQTQQAYWRGQYKQLKAWLIGHGVAPENVNDVDPQDLVGTKVTIETKKSKSGFTNAVGVSVEGASGTSMPTAAAPTASAPVASAPVPAGVNPFRK